MAYLLYRLVNLALLLAWLSAMLPPMQPDPPEPAPLYQSYLPLMLYNRPRMSVFGLEASRLAPEQGFDGLVALNPLWVRRSGLLWKEVEPVPGGGYNWDSPHVRDLEEEMIRASQHNLQMILIVRGSPRWATDPYAADCAPINAAHYAAFARFMAEAVRRYSRPPYNVFYWEIGNEPDAYVFPVDSPFGCWGLTGDPYYGGRQYGEMLKQVYPAVKAVNPDVQVLNGGLLLGEPFDPHTGTGLMARFIEGVFVAGAGNSFDLLAYHSYSFYNGTTNGTSGPVDWKVPYLRNVMATYGVDKPLFNTEGALLCPIVSPECAQAQTDVIARLYARIIRDGVAGFVWYVYDNDSFYRTGMIDPGNPESPRPIYYAYRQAVAQLDGATYLGPLEDQPEAVEGYRFQRGDATTLIFWADSPATVSIALTANQAVTCSDWDGAPLACTPHEGGISLLANPSPRYVVITPAPAHKQVAQPFEIRGLCAADSRLCPFSSCGTTSRGSDCATYR